jgi:antitoxin HigA-1
VPPNKLPAATRKAIHPGEILLDEVGASGLSTAALARILKIPAKHMREIVHGKRSLTADTALRLARHFGTSAELWMNLQTMYDLDRARLKPEKTLARIKPRPKEPIF